MDVYLDGDSGSQSSAIPSRPAQVPPTLRRIRCPVLEHPKRKRPSSSRRYRASRLANFSRAWAAPAYKIRRDYPPLTEERLVRAQAANPRCQELDGQLTKTRAPGSPRTHKVYWYDRPRWTEPNGSTSPRPYAKKS